MTMAGVGSGFSFRTSRASSLPRLRPMAGVRAPPAGVAEARGPASALRVSARLLPGPQHRATKRRPDTGAPGERGERNRRSVLHAHADLDAPARHDVVDEEVRRSP